MGVVTLDALRLTELPKKAGMSITEASCNGNTRRKPLPHHTAGQPFLRGPIPWSWVAQAATANKKGRGRALHVALVLWQVAGCTKSTSITVSLSGKRMREMGLDRWAARRGLLALQKIGLVGLRSRPGRKLLVTILDAQVAAARSPMEAEL